MSDWKPLSVRTGERVEEGPYEGVPLHLNAHVIEWVDSALRRGGYIDEPVLRAILLRLQVFTSTDDRPSVKLLTLKSELEGNSRLILDTVDMLLVLGRGNAEQLRTTLRLAGSIWTIAEDNRSLQRRVSEAEAASKASAVSPNDLVSDELNKAWAAAFGLHPDSSDAWDHAIKAIEAILTGLVVPAQAKATLGHVVGEIKSDPSRWTMDLTSNGPVGDGETLLNVLQLVWANPDRHGNPSSRTPTQDEAEKIVKIAVMVVGLTRNGGFRKK
jgi:hypothetical protein